MGNAHTQVIPGGTVISGPSCTVALPARKGRASHHKRSLVWPKCQFTIKSGPRVLHAVNVVNLKVRRSTLAEARLIDPMLNVVRHGFAGTVKNRRLIHVVPESCHAVMNERLEFVRG